MTKPKGLNPAVGKDMVQCPVPGCSKTNIRRDNWQNHMKNKVICEGKKPVSISSALFKNANKDKRDHTRFFIDGGFSLDNLPSPVVIEEQIKVTKSKDISKMFQQPTARSGAGETPSVVRHEKSPELPEDPGVVGRISQVLPSGGILPPSSSSSSCETYQTTSHYCQICRKNVCNLPTCSVEYLGDEEKRVHKDCVQSPKSGEAGDQENNLEFDNFLQLQAADDIEIKTELVSPLLSEQESDHSSPHQSQSEDEEMETESLFSSGPASQKAGKTERLSLT